MEPIELARLAAATAEDKLARDVLILDLSQVSIMCDYFVVASAPTRIQTRDIARAIDEAADKAGIRGKPIQGVREGAWILIDYGTVVVHIFLEAERRFYDLEGLWSQARIVYDSREHALSQTR
ncbi:MAG: ribosome silencing factor [Candidatus Eremiobacterota bacterium]